MWSLSLWEPRELYQLVKQSLMGRWVFVAGYGGPCLKGVNHTGFLTCTFAGQTCGGRWSYQVAAPALCLQRASFCNSPDSWAKPVVSVFSAQNIQGKFTQQDSPSSLLKYLLTDVAVFVLFCCKVCPWHVAGTRTPFFSHRQYSIMWNMFCLSFHLLVVTRLWFTCCDNTTLNIHM